MPLTGSDPVLSVAMRAALLANPDTKAQDNAALTAMCDAISATVVAHIVANAVVTGTGGGPAPVVGTII